MRPSRTPKIEPRGRSDAERGAGATGLAAWKALAMISLLPHHNTLCLDLVRLLRVESLLRYGHTFVVKMHDSLLNGFM